MASPSFDNKSPETHSLSDELIVGNVSIDKASRTATISITWRGHDIKLNVTYNSPDFDEGKVTSDMKKTLLKLLTFEAIKSLQTSEPTLSFKIPDASVEKSDEAKVMEFNLELSPKKIISADPLTSYFKNISHPEMLSLLLKQPIGSYLIRDNPSNREQKIISFINSNRGISNLVVQQDPQNRQKFLVGPHQDVFRDIKDIFADPKYKMLLTSPITQSAKRLNLTVMDKINIGFTKNIPSKGIWLSDNDLKEKLSLQPDGSFTIICTENQAGYIEDSLTIMCKVQGQIKEIELIPSSTRTGAYNINAPPIRIEALTLEEIFSLPQTQQLAKYPYNPGMEPDVVLKQMQDAESLAKQTYAKALFGTFKKEESKKALTQDVLINQMPGSFFIYREPGEVKDFQHVIAYVDESGEINKMICVFRDSKYILNGKRYDSMHSILQDPNLKGILKYPLEAPIIKTSRGYKYPFLESPSAEEAILKLSPEELIAFTPYNKSITPQVLLDAANKIRKTLPEALETNPSLGTILHKLYETVALLFFQEGNVEDAFKIRALAAEATIFPLSHPLQQMSESIAARTKLQLNADFGAHFSELDSGSLKGGNLRAWSRVIDNRPVNRFEFKISKHTRNSVQSTLNYIKNNMKSFEETLPLMLKGREITISDVPYTFPCKTPSGTYTTINGYTPQNAWAVQIQIEGIGKVTIGNDTNYGCMINNVTVDMSPDFKDGEGLKTLHQMLTVLGLGPILTSQSKQDDQRIQMAQLFRAYCPREALQMEQAMEFYEWPVQSLRALIEFSIPYMKEIFKKYLDDTPELMKKIEIYPGRSVWSITDLADQMRAQGAYGLMRGAGSKSIEAGIETVCDLLSYGELSSQDRFQAGKIKMGTSSQEDLASGGGDQVFGRLINHALVDRSIEDFNFHGHVQVLMDLDVVNRGSYAFFADQFGVKHFQDINYKSYVQRPNLIEFAQIVTRDFCNNEVMIKNRVGPEYIKGLVVATEENKAKLIAALRIKGLIKQTDNTETINGYPLDQFIYVSTKFTDSMWNKKRT